MSMREWVKEKVVGISPELSIHDFRMVQGPSHTNLIFDVLAPQGFARAICSCRRKSKNG